MSKNTSIDNATLVFRPFVIENSLLMQYRDLNCHSYTTEKKTFICRSIKSGSSKVLGLTARYNIPQSTLYDWMRSFSENRPHTQTRGVVLLWAKPFKIPSKIWLLYPLCCLINCYQAKDKRQLREEKEIMTISLKKLKALHRSKSWNSWHLLKESSRYQPERSKEWWKT